MVRGPFRVHVEKTTQQPFRFNFKCNNSFLRKPLAFRYLKMAGTSIDQGWAAQNVADVWRYHVKKFLSSPRDILALRRSCKMLSTVFLVPTLRINARRLAALEKSEFSRFFHSAAGLALQWDGHEDIDTVCKLLRGNTTIRSWTSIGSQTPTARPLADALTAGCCLTSITLSKAGMEESGTRAIAQALSQENCRVELLNLSGNHVSRRTGTAIASMLRGNTSLRTLILQDHWSGSDFFEAIVGVVKDSNRSLTHLDVSKNKLSNELHSSFVSLIESNTSLRHLDLSETDFGAEGDSTWDSLISALRRNSTLTALHLSWNRLSEASSIALARSLGNNESLRELGLGYITQFGSLTDWGAMLKVNTTLRSLTMGGGPAWEPEYWEIARGLAENKSVTDFSIHSHQFGDDEAGEWAAVVTRNSSLRRLDLSKTSMVRHKAEILSYGLERNSTLRTLLINENNFGPDGLIAIADALRTNKWNQISHLNLGYCMVEGPGYFGDNGIDRFADMIQSNTVLTELNLSGNHLSPDSGEIVAKSLAKNKSIRTLIMSNNRCESRGALAFAGALKANTTVEVLDFQNNGAEPWACASLKSAARQARVMLTI